MASGFLGRVPETWARAQVFVTLQKWNELPALHKSLIVQLVMTGERAAMTRPVACF
jgi:hypothetical protein